MNASLTTAPATNLTNSGTITSTGTLTAGLYATASKLASVSNDAGGRIENTVDGISLTELASATPIGMTVSGAVSNAGTIKASQYGIGLTGEADSSAGSLTNSGSITAGTAGLIANGKWTINGNVSNLVGGSLLGAGDGISLTGTKVTGAIDNAGTIDVDKTGILLASLNGPVASITNSGTITADATGISMVGASLSGGTGVTGNVTNSGTITSTGADADGIRLENLVVGGTVSNTTVGATEAGITATRYGIGLIGTGSSKSFTNDGTITAGTAGLYAAGTWAVNGDVSNLAGGKLKGTGNGISLAGTTVTGEVSNAGTIETAQTGILLGTGSSAGAVKNTNAITVTGSDADGINLKGTTIGTEISNAGEIRAVRYGIAVDTVNAAEAAPTTILKNTKTITSTTDTSPPLTAGLYATGSKLASVLNEGADAKITNTVDGISIADSTISGAVANQGTIEATQYGIGLSGTIASSAGLLTNSGSITAGTAGLIANEKWTINSDVANLAGGKLKGTGNGISLTGTTVTGAVGNAGTIDVDGTGIKLETLGGPIKSLVNSGTITADASGIVSKGNTITGDAGNTGAITALGKDADGILLNDTTVGGNLANTAGAIIEATRYGIGLTGTGSAKSFINRGTITADEAGMYAEGGWTIGEVANLSSNSLLGKGDGIRFTGTTVTGDLTNTGKIDVGGSGVSLAGTTLKGKILNTGTVSAGRDGFSLADAGSISMFGNLGTIIGGRSGISSTGSTKIRTLVNAQGVGNAAGGLTYSGVLPTNYHIVIDGSSYGQLFVKPDNHSGVMTFAISDLSKGVAPRTYSTVLTGMNASDLTNPDGAVWEFGKLGLLYLRLQAGSQTIWDLVMDYLPDTPDNVDDVQKATNSVFSERRAVLTAAMQYDCDRFDVRGICVDLAGRVTDEDGEVTGAAVVNAAVRLAEDFRLGFYLDQQLGQSGQSLHYATARIQQDYNTPLLGAYLGYKANEDGTGLQARISGGYQTGRLDIRRGEMKYSEEGQDETDIAAWYGFGTLGYGFSLGNSLLLTPYAGVQYTDVTRDGYGEDWAAVTKYPLSYDSYHERAFTVQAGLEVSGMFTGETGFEAALGLEYDVDRSANDFSGTSPIPGFESFSFEHDEEDAAKLRPTGMMSLFHDLTPTQRITGTIIAGQDAWSENFQGSALVAYRFSF